MHVHLLDIGGFRGEARVLRGGGGLRRSRCRAPVYKEKPW